MNVQDAYTAWSATYDSVANPTRDLDAEATRATLAGLRVGRTLELGCGTGKNTALLAGISAEVRALDFSEGMLARAREKVRAPNVTFAVADLTQAWPCPDGWAELIAGNLVLEHIEGLGHIFAQARRCLAPGGRLFLCELHPARQYRGLQANFATEAGQVHIPAFVHHIGDYLEGAEASGLRLERLREWWHTPERDGPPLVVSFLFAG